MKNTKEFVCYDAGCNTYVIEPYNPKKFPFHNDKDVYIGTYKECKEEKEEREWGPQPHYPNAPYGSIWDY